MTDQTYPHIPQQALMARKGALKARLEVAKSEYETLGDEIAWLETQFGALETIERAQRVTITEADGSDGAP